MPDIDFPLDHGAADTFNDAIRANNFCTVPDDLSRLSKYHHVSYRTAERWFTFATERRRCVLLEWEGSVPRQRSEADASRIFLGYSLADGMMQLSANTGKTAEYHVDAAALQTLNAYVTEMVFGGVDPWLERAWQHMYVRCIAPQYGWRLTVVYRRKGSDDPGT